MPEFRLPDLGEGLTEAVIVEWLVQVGDPIRVDQPVVEVETAKARVEVPAPFAGVVGRLHGEVGETLAVGAALLTVDEAGFAEPGVVSPAADESGRVLVGYGTSLSTRRHRRSRAATPPVTAGSKPVISPLVRRLARENGIDLEALNGTGAQGTVSRRDVEQAMALRPETPGPTVGAPRTAELAKAPGPTGRRTAYRGCAAHPPHRRPWRRCRAVHAFAARDPGGDSLGRRRRHQPARRPHPAQRRTARRAGQPAGPAGPLLGPRPTALPRAQRTHRRATRSPSSMPSIWASLRRPTMASSYRSSATRTR